MSSDGSVSPSEMDGRFKTPMPELYDHRPRLNPSPQVLTIPHLEVQQPTPKASIQDPLDVAPTEQAMLRQGMMKEATATTTMARDFENAVESDQSDNEFDNPPGNGRRNSGKARRLTNRIGRAREQARHDKSRDSSSSRSTSPANSVEAFAEPRRRQRANTVDSRRSSIIEQLQRVNAAYSQHSHSRRPTVSNISVPPALARGLVQDAEEKLNLLDDEEPFKTYKIDFEELDEFVALYAQGKISDEYPRSHAADSAVSKPKKTFGDCRRKNDHLPNAILNGDNFFEKPIAESSTADSSGDEKLAPGVQPFGDDYERFTFFSSEIQSGINATKLGDFVADGTSFRDLFDIDGTWWLDVLNPTRAELEVLAKAFKIHRLTREDIQTQESREKVELFSQYYFVCFRSFNMDKNSEDFLDPVHIYIVVTADGVLSFSFDKTPHPHNVRKRISKRGDFTSLGPDYICYAMIDDIVDCFAPIIQEAENESENIEDLVFIAREDDLAALLRQIGGCRKRVLNMMRLLGGKADVIKGFAKRCNEQYEIAPRGDIGLYLGDIQDHVVTMMSNLGHVEKMLSRSHANYLAQLSVDNILKDVKTNKALAKITVVATILVPLNLITGLFGMNVNVPGKDADGLGWFFGIIGVIAALVVVCLTIARHMRAL